MFSQEEFIETSRRFVCVRIESYESAEYQRLVRSLLGGRFENTAFCLFAPDGETRLSGTGRSPVQGLVGIRGVGGADALATVVAEMAAVAARYPGNGNDAGAAVPDFHSFRQALNVASADQRLLVLALTPARRETLEEVANHPSIVGRFHFDIHDPTGDGSWKKAVAADDFPDGDAMVIIRPGTFGMDGTVLARIGADQDAGEIRSTLLAANGTFASGESRKTYSEHVREGRRSGVYFEGNVPYGEDRDGDGKIDHRGGHPPRNTP